MKKLVITIAVVMLSALIAVSGFAGSSNSVNEQGSVEVDAIKNSGGSNVGSWASGNVNGSYRAEGHHDAWGETDGSVLLKTNSFEGDHFAKSSAFGKVDSSAAAKGNRVSDVDINGEVKQANWTLLEKGSDFAEAWNKTSASYEGGMDRRGISKADGSAEAGGKSFSFLKSNENEIKAAAGTFGFSEGNIRTEHSDPTANGFGQAVLGISRDFGGGTAAAVSAEGNSNYAAQGPRNAEGSLRANAIGNIQLLTDGIKATASSSSASDASAR